MAELPVEENPLSGDKVFTFSHVPDEYIMFVKAESSRAAKLAIVEKKGYSSENLELKAQDRELMTDTAKVVKGFNELAEKHGKVIESYSELTSDMLNIKFTDGTEGSIRVAMAGLTCHLTIFNLDGSVLETQTINDELYQWFNNTNHACVL